MNVYIFDLVVFQGALGNSNAHWDAVSSGQGNGRAKEQVQQHWQPLKNRITYMLQ